MINISLRISRRRKKNITVWAVTIDGEVQKCHCPVQIVELSFNDTDTSFSCRRGRHYFDISR